MSLIPTLTTSAIPMAMLRLSTAIKYINRGRTAEIPASPCTALHSCALLTLARRGAGRVLLNEVFTTLVGSPQAVEPKITATTVAKASVLDAFRQSINQTQNLKG
jgi:hypothetical protein